jgi:exopolysaccharide biosynthesis polyprenyl glycosylphosphotransferase
VNNNGGSQKYWLGVLRHFLVDAVFFAAAFLIGIGLRFENRWYWKYELGVYYPGILIGAVAFACIAYILNLYSLRNYNQSPFVRSLLLALNLTVVAGMMTGFFYLNFSARIGRGVMLLSGTFAYLFVLLHHLYLLHKFRNFRERVALIVTSRADEVEAEFLNQLGGHYLNLVGIVHYDRHLPAGQLRVLGQAGDLAGIVARERLDRVICTNQSILDPAMCQQFCKLRYSGITVMPLVSVFEEICQCIPVDLLSPEWLMNASGAPHMLYIKKLKRAFDIITALAGLLCFWPFLLLGMVIIKLGSRGPVLYRQTRCGRFGKPFQVLKLRTMKLNAETGDTAVWAKANDPRAIWGGNFLRRYRIDEIPQLWNVLRGEMSFVGPRPERPEFVEQLNREIPYFQERLLIQPGITGWAQVNYPYGASTEDAKRKLEYDLYYAKNMSVFLDVFILLDTVRIILRGGADKHPTAAGNARETAPRVPKEIAVAAMK